MQSHRILVVNAEQFGRDVSANRDVIAAYRDGIVTSASVLVREEGAPDAAARSREHPGLALGLHVDAGREGEGETLATAGEPWDADALAEEVLYQLAAFRALFGRYPSHLDSQGDLHRNEPLRSVLLTVAGGLGIPLRHFSPLVRSTVVRSPVGKEGPTRGTPLTPDELRELIARLPRGCTELVWRPGHDGETGLDLLCDPALQDELERSQVQRTCFRELVLRDHPIPHPRGCGFAERGHAAYRRRDFRRAVLWFRRETGRIGHRAEPWFWLSRSLFRAGETDEAMSAAERMTHLRPDWPAGLLHLTDLHLEAGRQDSAAAALARLVSASGSDDIPTSALAERIHRLDDAQAAFSVARALAVERPDDERAAATAAVILSRTGNDSEAPRAARRGGPRSLAAFHAETGDGPAAWSVLRKLRLTPDDAPVVLRTAHSLRKAGDLTRAWRAFEEAVSLGADDRTTVRWRDQVLGMVRVLSGHWAPSVPQVGAYVPFPGRVLHLVPASLPFARTEHALRIHRLVKAEREAGLDPHVVTRMGFPWDVGEERALARSEVDGIHHHRIPPADGGSVPTRLDERLEATAAHIAMLVRRLRPAVLHVSPEATDALVGLALRRECGVPVVYEPEALPLPAPPGEREPPSEAARWRRRREIECLREVDRSVVRHPAARDALTRCGVETARIVVRRAGGHAASLEEPGRWYARLYSDLPMRPPDGPPAEWWKIVPEIVPAAGRRRGGQRAPRSRRPRRRRGRKPPAR